VNITTMIIMLVIGIGSMIGLGTFYTTQLTAYNITPSSFAVASYNNFTQSLNSVNSSLSQIQTGTAGVFANGIFSIAGVYDITVLFLGMGKILLSIPSLLGNFINLMIINLSGTAIVPPSWFGTVIIIIIIVIATFQVLRMFTRSFFEI